MLPSPPLSSCVPKIKENVIISFRSKYFRKWGKISKYLNLKYININGSRLVYSMYTTELRLTFNKQIN